MSYWKLKKLNKFYVDHDCFVWSVLTLSGNLMLSKGLQRVTSHQNRKIPWFASYALLLWLRQKSYDLVRGSILLCCWSTSTRFLRGHLVRAM